MIKSVAAATVKSINVYRCKMVKEDSVSYGDTVMKSPKDIAVLATSCLDLHEAAEENFIILCLNTKNRITGIHTISVGSLNSSIVHPREVFKAAILNNASGIILLHNHPSGDPEPSREDIETTQRVVNGGNILGIKVLDHVIIGDVSGTVLKYTSFKEQGLM